jgi:dihydrodipicolinate synthase/N-acetylneuraminate lyase
MENKMKKKEIKGVITVLLTPFTIEGEPDLRTLKKLVDFVIERGVHGLFPCGSYGMGPLMMVEERKKVLEAVVEANNSRVSIVAHIGAIETKSTVDLAKHAEKVGVDAISSVPPFYYHYEGEEIVDYFKEIMNAVKIPVYAYNNALTGNLLTPELFIRLTEIGLKGMKDASKDLHLFYKYQRLAPSDFNLLMGTEEFALPSMVMEGKGFTTGMACAFPEITVKLYETCAQKDYVNAAKIQKKLLKVFDIMQIAPPKMQIAYECVRLRGIDIGQPKPPFRLLSEELKQCVKEELSDLGMLSEPYL